MSLPEINQNSKKISELDVGIPSNNDYLIIERMDKNGNKQSYRISYLNFKKSISKYISTIGTKDMIHCDKKWFSKFAHGHNYSNFNFFPTYKNENENIKLGEFKIRNFTQGKDNEDTEIKELYEPKGSDRLINELEGYNPNHVGDVKFIAVKNFRDYLTNYLGYTIGSVNGIDNILIDGKFDGWVIPNGARYSCRSSQFTSACALFSGDSAATQINVPDMGCFLKGQQTGEKYSYVPYQNALVRHNHEINTDYSTQEMTIECPVFEQISTGNKQDAVNRGSLHGAKGSPCTKNGCGKVQVEITNVTLTDTSIKNAYVNSVGSDIESYPTHINIPCLIYIGLENS